MTSRRKEPKRLGWRRSTSVAHRVFLANANLVAYSRKMLVDQLDIPGRVVELVDPFIDDLLSRYWTFTHGARPRQRRLTALERAGTPRLFRPVPRGHAGDALASLRAADQRTARSVFQRSMWVKGSIDFTASPLSAPSRTRSWHAAAAKAKTVSRSRRAFASTDIYREVQRPYEAFRQALSSDARAAFDQSFQQVLFTIYDPLAAVAAAFGPLRMEGGGRIARGTGHQAREAEVLDAVGGRWAQRRYGPEEQPWFAWLLRFALSEVDDPQGQGRFRMMPGALDAAGGEDDRWTHVALDEAQDLSVAEASLLTSLRASRRRGNCVR